MGGQTGASKAAAAADAKRNAEIKESIDAITKAYSSPERQQQYENYGRTLTDYYTGQVKEQSEANARNLKFSLARGGLTGGSAAIDADTQLQKDYTKGLLAASQQAQAGKASLIASDQSAKQQLISLAQQGAYTGTAATQAGEAQRAALETARGNYSAAALGDLFKGTAEIYRNQQTAAANRRASQQPIGSLYGNTGYG